MVTFVSPLVTLPDGRRVSFIIQYTALTLCIRIGLSQCYWHQIWQMLKLDSWRVRGQEAGWVHVTA